MSASVRVLSTWGGEEERTECENLEKWQSDEEGRESLIKSNGPPFSLAVVSGHSHKRLVSQANLTIPPFHPLTPLPVPPFSLSPTYLVQRRMQLGQLGRKLGRGGRHDRGQAMVGGRKGGRAQWWRLPGARARMLVVIICGVRRRV